MLPLVDRIPPWLFILLLAVLMALALELGHRLGRDAEEGSIVAIQSAVLGLAGLLLGFSFSLADSRFDARRLMVVKEANAIGTMYLRAGLMPEPARSGLRNELQRYVDLRLESADPRTRPPEFEQLLGRTNALQSEMWRLLEDHASQTPAPVQLLSTEALNAVIDVSAERAHAARTRIPGLVLVLLAVVILCGSVAIAYRPGEARRPLTRWAIFAAPLLLALYTVLDLNSPRLGTVHTSQQAMLELRDSIRAGAPSR